ncbi:alpha/beta hydrolase, partial [Klebsiella pneumoniae]|nr:alpha/beta hydrolase [Klebsiella pneumoniae]
MAVGYVFASLVEVFMVVGLSSSLELHNGVRRAGYMASAVLAGVTEPRVPVVDITVEGMPFRVVFPPAADGLLP